MAALLTEALGQPATSQEMARWVLHEIGKPADAAILAARARELDDDALEEVGQHLMVRLMAVGRFAESDEVLELLALEQQRRARERAVALAEECAERRERLRRVVEAVAAAPAARAPASKIRKGEAVAVREGSPSWADRTKHGLWDAGELGGLVVTRAHRDGSVDAVTAAGAVVEGLRAADLERRA